MSTFIVRLASSGPGLRVAIKDLIDLAGMPTTSGSKVIAATAAPAAADAECVAGTRAAEAGGQATIVGKTNLHELAFGVTGINPWFGTPVNPIDPRLIPGGSSSGSAVAVAAGEADVAFGTDTGGSIRIPAACCGVMGLKTTRGRVPSRGVGRLAPSFDTIGPMATSAAMLTAGMALLEPGFAAAAQGASRVGRVRLRATSTIDAALDRALAAAGLEPVTVELPGWSEATLAAMTILSAEAWNVLGDLWRQHGHGLSPDVSARLEGASLISPDEVASSWEVGRAWANELRAVFERVEVLALPTLAEEPPSLDSPGRMSDIRYATPINLAGVPALSMPLPVRGSGRVPPSLQLVGPARSEELLVSTAAAIEAAAAGG